MGEVDVAGAAVVPRQIGVVQHVIGEPVSRQQVSPVVRLRQRPVVSQTLGAEHQHPVVAQLVILDDRQRLERFAEAHAVREDAAAVALQLVDSAHHPVTLKPVKLGPDDGVADARGGAHDMLLVHHLTRLGEERVENAQVDLSRRPSASDAREQVMHAGGCVSTRAQGLPMHSEPGVQLFHLITRVGDLNQAQGGLGGQAQSLAREGAGADERFTRSIAFEDDGGLERRASTHASYRRVAQPLGDFRGVPSEAEPVTKGTLALRVAEMSFVRDRRDKLSFR